MTLPGRLPSQTGPLYINISVVFTDVGRVEIRSIHLNQSWFKIGSRECARLNLDLTLVHGGGVGPWS